MHKSSTIQIHRCKKQKATPAVQPSICRTAYFQQEQIDSVYIYFFQLGNDYFYPYKKIAKQYLTQKHKSKTIYHK